MTYIRGAGGGRPKFDIVRCTVRTNYAIASSVDLHWRIVWLYYYKQYRIGEIADLLVVCTKTVKRILTRYDETGTVDPKGMDPSVP